MTAPRDELLFDERACENALVAQLRALARAPEGEHTFTFRDGPVEVEVHYRSGSGSNVSLRARFGAYAPPPASALDAPPPSAPPNAYRADGRPRPAPHRAPRPLEVRLRSETDADRDAKESGVAREVQTGDAAFDREVYIDASADDATLRYVLAPQPVRDAVRALLAEGFSSVTLDDAQGNVSAGLFTFASGRPDEGRAQRIVRAFLALAQHLPPVEASDEAPRGDPLRAALGALSVLAGLLLTAGPIAFFLAAPAACVEHLGEGEASLRCHVAGCCSGAPLGLAAGLPLGAAAGYALSRLARGRTNSHQTRTWALLVGFFLTLELCVVVAGVAAWPR